MNETSSHQLSVPQEVTPTNDFRRAYCRKYRVLPERFVQAVFWQCLPSNVQPLARLIHTLAPNCFKEDFALIRNVAKASSPQDISQQLESQRGQTNDSGLLRGTLKLRISPERLISLAADLMQPHRERNCARN